MLDARLITPSYASEDGGPVTTSVYTVVVCMNEGYPDDSQRGHIERFAQEFQRALDDGYFTDVRYDHLDFDVVSRVPVHTNAPGGGELSEDDSLRRREREESRL